ncbi:hypothetical protein BDF20DRAFT_814107 [Mycotypha africana]|uniref:uncharacterized protein n=1 Tax=Mycotypha africana TaxID=64632 RepID=UPI0023018CC8|nr:uncharacterized protein BDF20DRAFT_814107 [Mycotypha africana]KAI8988564.1 hypothetical protein BDF20DRAFT_814107 [Mycotypha africana]
MQLQIVSFIGIVISVFANLVTASPAITTTENTVLKRKDYDGEHFGIATWYSPHKNGGPQGACWDTYIDDDSEIVALNGPQYGDEDEISKHCGAKVEIWGPKGSTKATVMDVCSECSWGELDLTPLLFERVVGDLDIGVGEISWNFY